MECPPERNQGSESEFRLYRKESVRISVGPKCEVDCVCVCVHCVAVISLKVLRRDLHPGCI